MCNTAILLNRYILVTGLLLIASLQLVWRGIGVLIATCSWLQRLTGVSSLVNQGRNSDDVFFRVLSSWFLTSPSCQAPYLRPNLLSTKRFGLATHSMSSLVRLLDWVFRFGTLQSSTAIFMSLMQVEFDDCSQLLLS